MVGGLGLSLGLASLVLSRSYGFGLENYYCYWTKTNLAMSSREVAMLKELVDILQPFAEATDKAQGNDARISCVVPTVVAFHKYLSDQQKIVRYHSSLVRQLLQALEKRFQGLLIQVRILPGNQQTSTDTYGSIKYPVSTVLDPQFGFFVVGAPSSRNPISEE